MIMSVNISYEIQTIHCVLRKTKSIRYKLGGFCRVLRNFTRTSPSIERSETNPTIDVVIWKSDVPRYTFMFRYVICHKRHEWIIILKMTNLVLRPRRVILYYKQF